jgi:multimeric flavodoxin WrbA
MVTFSMIRCSPRARGFGKGGLKMEIKTGGEMKRIVAVYGSPRKKGNTALLLDEAVRGAEEAGAQVAKIHLRELKMSPCLEIYGCQKDGRCVIKDDFQKVYDLVLGSQGIILASPIFFYAVSAQVKILMDRFQALWVKKYWIDQVPLGTKNYTRRGLLIAVGASTGKKLFDGALLSVKYFFDVLDTEFSPPLLYRGLDFEGDVLKHPPYLQEAFAAGKKLAEEI